MWSIRSNLVYQECNRAQRLPPMDPPQPSLPRPLLHFKTHRLPALQTTPFTPQLPQPTRAQPFLHWTHINCSFRPTSIRNVVGLQTFIANSLWVRRWRPVCSRCWNNVRLRIYLESTGAAEMVQDSSMVWRLTFERSSECTWDCKSHTVRKVS